MTRLSEKIGAALEANAAKPEEEREYDHVVVDRVWEEFISFHGQEAFDAQVIQQGGRLQWLSPGIAFDVIVRNQVRIMKQLGMIRQEGR